MGRLFGTDGIRGVANEYPLTAEALFGIGRAVSLFFSGTALEPRMTPSEVTKRRHSLSMILSASASAENPPKTMLWTAPILVAPIMAMARSMVWI